MIPKSTLKEDLSKDGRGTMLSAVPKSIVVDGPFPIGARGWRSPRIFPSKKFGLFMRVPPQRVYRTQVHPGSKENRGPIWIIWKDPYLKRFRNNSYRNFFFHSQGILCWGFLSINRGLNPIIGYNTIGFFCPWIRPTVRRVSLAVQVNEF